MIDIGQADRAEVLLALWNGCLNYTEHSPALALLQLGVEPMTIEQARALVAGGGRLDFDYVEGRSLKVDITGPLLDEWLYDRDSGAGAARRALAGVKGVQFP